MSFGFDSIKNIFVVAESNQGHESVGRSYSVGMMPTNSMPDIRFDVGHVVSLYFVLLCNAASRLLACSAERNALR